MRLRHDRYRAGELSKTDYRAGGERAIFGDLV